MAYPPNIVIVEKLQKTTVLMDVVILNNCKIKKKEHEDLQILEYVNTELLMHSQYSEMHRGLDIFTITGYLHFVEIHSVQRVIISTFCFSCALKSDTHQHGMLGTFCYHNMKYYKNFIFIICI